MGARGEVLLSFLSRPPGGPDVTTRLSAAQRGYDANWRKLRKQVLTEEPLCKRCEREGRVTESTIVDHVIPIDQRPDLRLERSNCESMCKAHHDAEKQQEDRRGFSTGVDASGWPRDPQHPFYRDRE